MGMSRRQLTEFGSLYRLTPSRGERKMYGHYLKTRLVDHYLGNNKGTLGQDTQNT